MVAMLLLTWAVGSVMQVLPASLGAQIEYYYLDSLVYLLWGTLCVVATARIMGYFQQRDRQLSQREHGQQEETEGVVDRAEQQQDKDNECLDLLLTELNLLIVVGVILGYPTLVIPFYVSPSTTDWVRIFICCFVHPLVTEVVKTIQRLKSSLSRKQRELVLNDPQRHYFARKFRGKREIILIARGMKLTSLCSHAPAAALLPARVGQW